MRRSVGWLAGLRVRAMIPDCQRWREPEPPLRVEVVRPHSEADVLTVAETAKRLRIRRADCQAWLERLGLLVDVAGSPRVVWGSVIRALQAPEPPCSAS